jgi:hemerythrin-like metal-binding protein
MSIDPHCLVIRDEMLDARKRICGYRFRVLPRDPLHPLGPAAKAEALRGDKLATFAERRLAVVPLTLAEWTSRAFHVFAGPNLCFHLETPGAHDDFKSWLEALAQIKACGAQIALSKSAVSFQLVEALQLADVLFIPAGENSVGLVEQFIATVGAFRPGIRYAVDGVHTWTEYHALQDLGVEFCLGDFAKHHADSATDHAAASTEEQAPPLVLFTWNTAYACGHEGIDRDHQMLFVVANKLLNAMANGIPPARLKEIVHSLLLETARHFKREEEILNAVGYARAGQHALAHKRLLEKANRLVSDFDVRGAEIGPVFQYLTNDLILGHMIGADKDFFPLLRRSVAALPK